MRAARPTLASGLMRMMWQTSIMSCPTGRSVWHALLLDSFGHVCNSWRCTSLSALMPVGTHEAIYWSWFLYGCTAASAKTDNRQSVQGRTTWLAGPLEGAPAGVSPRAKAGALDGRPPWEVPLLGAEKDRKSNAEITPLEVLSTSSCSICMCLP